MGKLFLKISFKIQIGTKLDILTKNFNYFIEIQKYFGENIISIMHTLHNDIFKTFTLIKS